MINLDDMTLEELQQLLTFNKRDSNDVRRIQELSGLTGKDVDGIWGKQTSAAWKKFGDEELSPAIDDEQRFQDAMARGQKSPYVADILGYSNERDKKINSLQSQIEMIKERLARNKRTLFDNKGAERVANMEFKKFNSSDPSTLWRWRQDREDIKEANANVKSKEAAQFANTVDMWNTTRLPDSTAAREQMISNLNSTIRDGRNAGVDVSDLLTLKAKWEKITYGNDTNSSVNYGVGSETEQKAGELETALKIAKTSAELIKLKDGYKGWKPNQVTKLDTRITELQKKEKSNADEVAFQSWAVGEIGKPWDKITDVAKAALRREWKDKKGVK